MNIVFYNNPDYLQVLVLLHPSDLALLRGLQLLLLCQLFPGGQVVGAVLQHRGQLRHQLGQQVIARQADATEETNLGVRCERCEGDKSETNHYIVLHTDNMFTCIAAISPA